MADRGQFGCTYHNKRILEAKRKNCGFMMLLSLAASSFIVFSFYDIVSGVIAQGKPLSDRQELSSGDIHNKFVWRGVWKKNTIIDTKLYWVPIWQKRSFLVWKVEETPQWINDHFNGWEVVRRPTWLQVKVPIWMDVEIPVIKKVWKPMIKEKQIPIATSELIPEWRKVYKPTWKTENIPGATYFGTDDNGWQYVGKDVWRRKLFWTPAWKKIWNVAQKDYWLNVRQLEWKEKYQLVLKTKKQPIWVMDKLDDAEDEVVIPIWKNVEKDVLLPIQTRMWVNVWSLHYFPILDKVKVTSWKKIWMLGLERVNGTFSPVNPWMVPKGSGNLAYFN